VAGTCWRGKQNHYAGKKILTPLNKDLPLRNKNFKNSTMNKTVTINISGIIFHIEEDAYETLSRYLSTIKGYFSKTDGGNEIMSDIEARIAELLQAKINISKQVILMTDVEHVMNVMGKPEDFGAEPSREESTKQEERSDLGDEKIKRRLYRNPDEKAVGGVCSGLAAYFDIDMVWVRLAMFLLIFFGGLSLWVYLILWIVIPEAKTTAEKLEMRGEQANINSIYKSFQEEAEDLKNRGKRQYEDVSRTVRTNLSYARNTSAGVLNAFFNVIGRLIGLFFIFVGGVFLCAYVAGLFGISFMDSNNHLMHWRRVILESPTDYALGIFSFIIVIGIPVMMLIYAGVKLVFRIRYHNRWLNLGLGILWTIGLVTAFYVTMVTIKQFSENSHIRESYTLRGTGDTLIIKMNPGTFNVKDMKFENNDDIEHFLGDNHNDYFFGESNGHLSVIGFADLNVSESNSDSIEMTITRSAHGRTKKEANENARAIDYAYHQDKNVLTFDQIFVALEGTRFRAQDLDIKIKLPKGTVVYFDKATKYLLDDIDNTSNTWDGKMISRRWKMTEKGLECIDCEGLDKDDESGQKSRGPRNRKEKIIIDGHGIRSEGGETEINIDEKGVKIRTEQEVEVENP